MGAINSASPSVIPVDCCGPGSAPARERSRDARGENRDLASPRFLLQVREGMANQSPVPTRGSAVSPRSTGYASPRGRQMMRDSHSRLSTPRRPHAGSVTHSHATMPDCLPDSLPDAASMEWDYECEQALNDTARSQPRLTRSENVLFMAPVIDGFLAMSPSEQALFTEDLPARQRSEFLRAVQDAGGKSKVVSRLAGERGRAEPPVAGWVRESWA